MAEAFRSIKLGESDVIITGGTESAVTELGIAGFCAMRALCESDAPPETVSRPFDSLRDGFVIAEGAGILVFEELEHAKKRGAPILGEVLGCGATADACHITKPDAEGIYPAAAMKATLKSASLSPDQIDYINLHGTATKLGDVAETNAIKRAFGECAYTIPMSSNKSQVGHLLGGSGGLEAIFSLLTIRDGIVPPTINLTSPDPECDLDYVPLKAREVKVRRVMSNSLGFGGHNACIVIGRFE
jgi:3-oxoacyl-[acyl-carrier-protein] synthase II